MTPFSPSILAILILLGAAVIPQTSFSFSTEEGELFTATPKSSVSLMSRLKAALNSLKPATDCSSCATITRKLDHTQKKKAGSTGSDQLFQAPLNQERLKELQKEHFMNILKQYKRIEISTMTAQNPDFEKKLIRQYEKTLEPQTNQQLKQLIKIKASEKPLPVRREELRKNFNTPDRNLPGSTLNREQLLRKMMLKLEKILITDRSDDFFKSQGDPGTENINNETKQTEELVRQHIRQQIYEKKDSSFRDLQINYKKLFDIENQSFR